MMTDGHVLFPDLSRRVVGVFLTSTTSSVAGFSNLPIKRPWHSHSPMPELNVNARSLFG